MYVGEQIGLDYNLFEGEALRVEQVTTDFEGYADEWNPNIEFTYTHQATGHFVGFKDHRYRYWGFDTAEQTWVPEDLILGSSIDVDVGRVNQWAPDPDNATQNHFTIEYLGKDIIDTLWGKREVCVTRYSGQFAYVKTPQAQGNFADVYIDEVFTDYVDKDKLIQRSDRHYLEYPSPEMVTATGGYTNYRKQLEGVILEESLYGKDPAYGDIPTGQPVTFEQCLDSFEETDTQTITLDITRSVDDELVQYGSYYWDLKSNDDITVAGRSG